MSSASSSTSSSSSSLSPQLVVTTEICIAAEAGDTATLRSKFASHLAPSIECTNERRYTPLMLASGSQGSYHTLQFLLSRGANVNAVHPDSEATPLLFACMTGNIPGAVLLLKAGANPASADAQGRTALHWASLNGSVLLAKKILRRTRGSIINAQDTSGYTALMTAAEHGREDIARLLLEWNANAILRNKLNHTAIELADWFGHRSLCTALESSMAAMGQLSIEAQTILAAQAAAAYGGNSSSSSSSNNANGGGVGLHHANMINSSASQQLMISSNSTSSAGGHGGVGGSSGGGHHTSTSVTTGPAISPIYRGTTASSGGIVHTGGGGGGLSLGAHGSPDVAMGSNGSSSSGGGGGGGIGFGRASSVDAPRVGGGAIGIHPSSSSSSSSADNSGFMINGGLHGSTSTGVGGGTGFGSGEGRGSSAASGSATSINNNNRLGGGGNSANATTAPIHSQGAAGVLSRHHLHAPFSGGGANVTTTSGAGQHSSSSSHHHQGHHHHTSSSSQQQSHPPQQQQQHGYHVHTAVQSMGAHLTTSLAISSFPGPSG